MAQNRCNLFWGNHILIAEKGVGVPEPLEDCFVLLLGLEASVCGRSMGRSRGTSEKHLTAEEINALSASVILPAELKGRVSVDCGLLFNSFASKSTLNLTLSDSTDCPDTFVVDHICMLLRFQRCCTLRLCPEQGSHPGVHLDFEAAHPDIASSAPCIAQLVCGHIKSFERLGCSRRQAVAADLRPEVLAAVTQQQNTNKHILPMAWC